MRSACIKDTVVGILGRGIREIVPSNGLMRETYEEYIAIDVLGAATHRLKRSKAGAASGNAKVHQGSRNGRIVSWTDQKGEGWQCRRAREGVSALGLVIGSAAYFCILGFKC